MKQTKLNARSKYAACAGSRPGAEPVGPPGAVIKRLALATAVALLVLPAAESANANSLGELDVRSRLGERFYGAVPVQLSSGFLDPNCVRVRSNPNAPAGAESLRGTRVRTGSADTVIIETSGPVTSPVVGLRLEVGCERPIVRDYVVLGEGGAIAGLTDTPAYTGARSAAAVSKPVPSKARTAAQRRATIAQSPRRPSAATSVEVPTAASAPAPVSRQPVTIAPVPPAQASGSTANRGAAAATPTPVAERSDAERRLTELRARSDDQAAALLALDDRLALLQKQAELLKLQIEHSMANPSAAQQAAPAAAATVAPSDTPSSASVAATSAGVTPVAAKSAPAAVAAEAPPRREPGVWDLLSNWGVAGGLAALVVGAFMLRRSRRPVFKTAGSSIATTADDRLLEPRDVALETRLARAASSPHRTQPKMAARVPTAAETAQWKTSTANRALDQTAEWIAPPTTDTMPAAASAAADENRINTSREFHITQQFGPSDERVVATASPEEIVQQARTHYMDDGDVFHAIDLLEMAVSARKDSTRPWQALFAIYHRERMTERFQRLALSYRANFAEDENWPTIGALGLAIDPYNKLYGETPAAPLPEDLTERWLGVPLDFTAHLLANEMHDQLMSTIPGRQRRQRTAQE